MFAKVQETHPGLASVSNAATFDQYHYPVIYRCSVTRKWQLAVCYKGVDNEEVQVVTLPGVVNECGSDGSDVSLRLLAAFPSSFTLTLHVDDAGCLLFRQLLPGSVLLPGNRDCIYKLLTFRDGSLIFDPERGLTLKWTSSATNTQGVQWFFTSAFAVVVYCVSGKDSPCYVRVFDISTGKETLFGALSPWESCGYWNFAGVVLDMPSSGSVTLVYSRQLRGEFVGYTADVLLCPGSYVAGTPAAANVRVNELWRLRQKRNSFSKVVAIVDSKATQFLIWDTMHDNDLSYYALRLFDGDKRHLLWKSGTSSDIRGPVKFLRVSSDSFALLNELNCSVRVLSLGLKRRAWALAVYRACVGK